MTFPSTDPSMSTFKVPNVAAVTMTCRTSAQRNSNLDNEEYESRQDCYAAQYLCNGTPFPQTQFGQRSISQCGSHSQRQIKRRSCCVYWIIDLDFTFATAVVATPAHTREAVSVRRFEKKCHRPYRKQQQCGAQKRHQDQDQPALPAWRIAYLVSFEHWRELTNSRFLGIVTVILSQLRHMSCCTGASSL